MNPFDAPGWYYIWQRHNWHALLHVSKHNVCTGTRLFALDSCVWKRAHQYILVEGYMRWWRTIKGRTTVIPVTYVQALCLKQLYGDHSRDNLSFWEKNYDL